MSHVLRQSIPHMHNRNVGLRGGASLKVGVACYIHVTYLNTAMNANKHGGGGGGGGGHKVGSWHYAF